MVLVLSFVKLSCSVHASKDLRGTTKIMVASTVMKMTENRNLPIRFRIKGDRRRKNVRQTKGRIFSVDFSLIPNQIRIIDKRMAATKDNLFLNCPIVSSANITSASADIADM